ncbi:hypothetical protein BRADI_2g34025v3 [Brachypodium distachyon]|uniref:Uncharacterized protein n=1 Tax=Brachypodium distachyon TaxID=15368 RepID=A0A0Q3G795_BRADI|nr:hypothetical protein BRADI_2g34025v3 [Brachypodium distachyon]
MEARRHGLSRCGVLVVGDEHGERDVGGVAAEEDVGDRGRRAKAWSCARRMASAARGEETTRLAPARGPGAGGRRAPLVELLGTPLLIWAIKKKSEGN